MADTSAQALLDQAKCYGCAAPNGYTLGLMKLALLAQISLAKNPANDVSPQGLMAASNCFKCYASNEYTLRLMELALLAQIAGP